MFEIEDTKNTELKLQSRLKQQFQRLFTSETMNEKKMQYERLDLLTEPGLLHNYFVQQRKIKIMEKDAPFIVLLKLSIPTMIGMILITLFSISKAILIGRLLGDKWQTAFQIFFPTEILFYSHFIISWSTGASVIISKLLGEKEIIDASITMCNHIYIVLAHSILMPLTFFFVLDPYLDLIGVTSEIKDMCMAYAETSTLISPLGYALSAGLEHFLMVQSRSVVLMLTKILMCASNIAFEIIFIKCINLEMKGIALSSFISNMITGLIQIYYIVSKESVFEFNKQFFRPKFGIILKIYKNGIPSLLQFIPKSIGSILSTVLIKNFATNDAETEELQMIYGLSNRIMSLVTMPVSGFFIGVQPLLGYNLGAKNYKRVYNILIVSYLTIIGLESCLSLLTLVYAKQLFSMFTKSVHLYAKAARLIRIHCGGVVLAQFMQLSVTVLQNEEKTVLASALQSIRVFIQLLMEFLLPYIYKNAEYIFMANIVGDIVGGIFGIVVAMAILHRYKALAN